MKKSITILAIAVFAFTNSNAANLKSSVVLSVDKPSISSYNKFEKGVGAKFVSFADPALIGSELGTLKKSPKTIDETIADDIKITEAVLPAKVTLSNKSKQKNTQSVELKKSLQS